MKKKIMFVANSAGVLESVKWIFKGKPYTIFAFNDPFKALVSLYVTEFAVVVADQSMQEMDGLEFIKTVRERSSDTVAIMLYAFIEPEIVDEAMNQDDVFLFVKKPIDNDKITQAVEMALVHYQMTIESRRLLALARANYKERQWQ
jgi:DNA-binding NtrC family response regulator